VIKLPWILLMQTAWTFLVYFWLLGGGFVPPPQTSPCVRACTHSQSVLLTGQASSSLVSLQTNRTNYYTTNNSHLANDCSKYNAVIYNYSFTTTAVVQSNYSIALIKCHSANSVSDSTKSDVMDSSTSADFWYLS